MLNPPPKPAPKTVHLDERYRLQLADLYEELGERATLELLGFHTKHTAARMLAGLPVLAGSAALFERALDRVRGARRVG
jgi:hypothetical protein